MSRRLNVLMVLAVVAMCLSAAVWLTARTYQDAGQITSCRARYHSKIDQAMTSVVVAIHDADPTAYDTGIRNLEAATTAYSRAVQASVAHPSRFLASCR